MQTQRPAATEFPALDHDLREATAPIGSEPRLRGKRTASVAGELLDRLQALDMKPFVLALLERTSASEDEFLKYLRSRKAAGGGLVAKPIERVETLWKLLNRARAPLPVAMPTHDDGLQLSWTSKNGRHLSMDIYADEWDWFFRDRQTDETDGGDVESFDELPEAFRKRLASLRDDG